MTEPCQGLVFTFGERDRAAHACKNIVTRYHCWTMFPTPGIASAASPRRLVFLTFLAAVLGVLGGVAAWVLIHLIALITNIALFHQWGWTTPSFSTLHRSPMIIVAAVAGAFVISFLAKWPPVIR